MDHKTTKLYRTSRLYCLFILLITYFLPGNLFAGVSPDSLKIDLSIQYRTMYNASNIPGPAGTSFNNLRNYDFFRQRFRIGLDVQPAKNVGGYVQLEFRNAWGAGSGFSDVRELSANDLGLRNVAFNRLTARGLRYAYVYASPIRDHELKVGILPLSDQVDDVLFSADWDFNVGGIVLEGEKLRVGYARLLEGIGAAKTEELGHDGHFFVGDWQTRLNEATSIGFHAYHFRNDITAIGKIRQTWIGGTATISIGEAKLFGFALLNLGELNGQNHTGFAAKVAADLPAERFAIKTQIIYSSGDKAGEIKNQFVTLQSLVGTAGYWSFSHIFTANGPSDVNDLGLDIGNTLGSSDRAGLITPQISVTIPRVTPKLALQLNAGYYLAAQERNNSQSMGTEISGHFTYKVAKYLNWDFGAAYALLGDFFENNSGNLYELFSRFQLEF